MGGFVIVIIFVFIFIEDEPFIFCIIFICIAKVGLEVGGLEVGLELGFEVGFEVGFDVVLEDVGVVMILEKRDLDDLNESFEILEEVIFEVIILEDFADFPPFSPLPLESSSRS